jgi:phosphatidylethanolamine/phosphatidyl-N-methylethanolamine N-methyltransferase
MGAWRSIRDALHFLGCFVRSPRKVASMFPSSRALANAVVADLPLVPGDVVVELGAGTGPITAALADVVARVGSIRCLVIEREPGFCRILRERYPNMLVHEGSVEDLPAILATYDLPPPKVVVGGLPYAAMPEPVVRSMLTSAHAALADGGVFRTFNFLGRHLLPGSRRLRRVLRDTFQVADNSARVWCNLPPALVMTGWKRERSGTSRPTSAPLHASA